MMLTRHMDAVCEEIARIGNEYNKTAFYFGEFPNMRKLQEQCSCDPNRKANHQTSEEDQQEEAERLKKADYAQIWALLPRSTGRIFPRRLEEHNGNGIVQDRLAKDNGIELGVDPVGVEYGKNGDWIGSG